MKSHLRTININDHRVFYRQAGSPDAPTVLLLHGFPTSSHMFRNLLPVLAEHYNVIAPDLPGFGFTESPEGFIYSFDNLSNIIEQFTIELGLKNFAIYFFDYGAPVGLRLAMAQAERVTALISQNGNAYVEGLSAGWNPIQQYWEDPSSTNRDALRGFLTPETTQWQYTHGVANPESIAPESYTLDAALLARAGNTEIQLDLFGDYQSNVAKYPEFQAYFRQHQPPMLAVWGSNDPFFLPAGATAFMRDLPKAEIHFYETGHFALETHGQEIAADIHNFLATHIRRA
ncbi:alpha/beta hydrolase [Iodobacter sp. LRB]|uniref:alpha/beta fold hydrolase n=1 Tax=unclassified Iodobacter TaxID=235634 RepID=UPI000C0E59B3|nr:alpha/beta hydrolase [Iodobacter sp. BJB302]PHU99878.1 alpha/beta hydrolase [Iodobacter sp. BJB302]